MLSPVPSFAVREVDAAEVTCSPAGWTLHSQRTSVCVLAGEGCRLKRRPAEHPGGRGQVAATWAAGVGPREHRRPPSHRQSVPGRSRRARTHITCWSFLRCQRAPRDFLRTSASNSCGARPRLQCMHWCCAVSVCLHSKPRWLCIGTHGRAASQVDDQVVEAWRLCREQRDAASLDTVV